MSVTGVSLLLCMSCFEQAPTQQPAVSMEVFRFSKVDHPDWSEQQYNQYDTISLRQIIDGGAGFFSQYGMVSGTFQKLASKDSTFCELFAMDFGTNANAARVIEGRKSTFSQIEQVGTYPQTKAFMYVVLAGVQAYAVFGQFYFEVLLGGYSDSTTAPAMAASILQWLEAKAR